MIQICEDKSTTGNSNHNAKEDKPQIDYKKRIKIRKLARTSIDIIYSKDGFKMGKWQKEEHLQFLQACEKHGNNWTKVICLFNFIYRYKKN
jgi:hypothetical protein